MADVLDKMQAQNDRTLMAGVRKDFGQGLDDVDDDTLLEAVHQGQFSDLDPESYYSALGKVYGGVMIKPPMTQERLGKTFQPNSVQVNVPVLPTEEVKGKAIMPDVPGLRMAHGLAGSFVNDVASLPANLGTAVNSLAKDMAAYANPSGPAYHEISAPEQEKATRGISLLGSFTLPEAMVAAKSLGAATRAAYAVEPAIKSFAAHAMNNNMTAGAIYEGLTGIGEGDAPGKIAIRSLVGAAAGRVLGAIGPAFKEFGTGLRGVETRIADKLVQAAATPTKSSASKVVERGLTPVMEKSFSDVLDKLRTGVIAAEQAATEILSGLGVKATPEDVQAFTQKIRHIEKPAEDVFGQLDTSTQPGPAPVMKGERLPESPPQPFFPGDTQQQSWQPPMEGAPPPNELTPEASAAMEAQRAPTAVPQRVLDAQTQYPQGYMPPAPSTFNPAALSTPEQEAIASKRVSEMARLKSEESNAFIGPKEQALLPPTPEKPTPTGAIADTKLPIWGIVADKINHDGYAVVGEIDPSTYLARDANGLEVALPKNQTYDPNLKGPDSTIPIPSAGSDAGLKAAKLLRLKKNPVTSATITAATHDIDKLGIRNPLNSKEVVIDNNVAVEVEPHGKGLVLHSLRAFTHKQGHGTAALKKIIDIADKHGLDIELSATPLATDKKIPKAKLISFYRKFGFVLGPDKERMIRKPKKAA